MKIIEQSWKWIQKPHNPLQIIEKAGRTCYKSENRITDTSAQQFVKSLIKRKHESVIEHISASVKLITNLGVTHELVRHRLASYSQESTRYVSYKKELVFIKPIWWDKWSDEERRIWLNTMKHIEQAYLSLLKSGSPPEKAREVLPKSLKTEIVVTANLREWRHIFKLRCSPKAHPQIRALMIDCLEEFKKEIPVVFDDII